MDTRILKSLIDIYFLLRDLNSLSSGLSLGDGQEPFPVSLLTNVVLLVVSHFGPDDCAPPLPFSDLAMQLQLLLSYLWWPCTSVYRLSVYLSLSITAYSDDTKRVGYSKEVD